MYDPEAEARRWLKAARDDLACARDLDLLYLPTRYPNGLEAGTPAEAFSAGQSEAALGRADRIVSAAALLAGC